MPGANLARRLHKTPSPRNALTPFAVAALQVRGFAVMAPIFTRPERSYFRISTARSSLLRFGKSPHMLRRCARVNTRDLRENSSVVVMICRDLTVETNGRCRTFSTQSVHSLRLASDTCDGVRLVGVPVAAKPNNLQRCGQRLRDIKAHLNSLLAVPVRDRPWAAVLIDELDATHCLGRPIGRPRGGVFHPHQTSRT